MNAKPLLAAAIAALLLSAPVAHAQSVSRETRPAQDSQSDDEEEGHSRHHKDDKAAQGPTFPNATREDPGKGKPKLGTKLNKINSELQSNDFDKAMADADAVLADPKATPFDRAQAAYLAAYAANNDDKMDKAIEYANRALAENVLQNNMHFALMQNLVQMYLQADKFEESLKLSDRFMAEAGMKDDKTTHFLRGVALYNLERYGEAIDELKQADQSDKQTFGYMMNSYRQADRLPEAIALAESAAKAAPNDKKAQLNLAALYAEAEQADKAAAVFQRLQAAGMLTDEKDYDQGYRLLANLEGHEKDTIAFILAGMEKGLIKPSAQVYSALGQSYYYSEQIPQAIEAWGKGAPLAPDGEMFLNLAKVNFQEEHWAPAIEAAQQAIAKGVKKPGQAWIVIGGSKAEAGDAAGAIAAYREAAKDPSTRDEANRQLKARGAR